MIAESVSLRVMAQASRNEEAVARITAAVHKAEAQGVSLRWDSRTVRPGETSRHRGATPQAIHKNTVYACPPSTDADARAVLRVLQRDLASLQGPDHWCNAHLTEDLRDAIHLPIPTYLIPATLAAWQEVGSLHGATVTLTTSGAAIVRLPPVAADAVLTAVARNGRTAHRPMRLQTQVPCFVDAIADWCAYPRRPRHAFHLAHRRLRGQMAGGFAGAVLR